MRPDGLKIPIGILPNGSGNDTCGGIQIDTLQEGLQYIKKGDLIKLDVVKVLLDHESEEAIEESLKTNHLRFSIINSGLCLTANCAKNAVKWKRLLGKHAYSLQTVIELAKMRSEKYDFLIDDDIQIENQDTQFILVYNAKYGGGRMMLNPLAIINDGHFEFLFIQNLIGFNAAIKLFDGAKNGGTHIYDERGILYRAKKVKITNKSAAIQDINIDGEDLVFKNFVKYECIHQAIDVICDFEYIIKKNFN